MDTSLLRSIVYEPMKYLAASERTFLFKFDNYRPNFSGSFSFSIQIYCYASSALISGTLNLKL